jgi:hypothetical protein
MNIEQAEAKFKSMTPRSEEFDLVLCEYFQYLSSELQKILDISEAGLMEFPIRFFEKEVSSLEELRSMIILAATGERMAVKERGRGHFGQIGDYFWDTSAVESLGEEKRRLDSLISLAVKRFGVDPEEFFRVTKFR